MKDVIVKIGDVNDAIFIHKQIPEFDINKSKTFHSKIKSVENVIYVAYKKDIKIGYIISYNRDNDNSIYCWMIGVIPKYRKAGVLSLLMKKFENWAINKKYKTIKIKTSNKRKEMITYLVKNDFLITKVYNETEAKEIINNRIDLQKTLKTHL